MSIPTTVRVTDLGIFKKCRAMYNYSHVLRLAPKDTLQDVLFLGTGLHKAVEELYNFKMYNYGDGPEPDLVKTWQKKMTDLGHTEIEPEVKKMSVSILEGYQKFHVEADKDWVIKGVETQLSHTVETSRGPITIFGRFDLDIEEDGVPWVVDHKGYKRMPDPKVLEIDEQMTLYSWLRWKNDQPVAGVIMNVFLKAIPDEIPTVYKDTALSQNKTLLTTYELYSAELDARGFDRSKYTEFLQMLRERDERTNPFFQRFYVRRTLAHLKAFEVELIAQLEDFIDARIYRTPGLQCAWCKYQELCTTEREGADTSQILSENFRVKFDFER